MTIDQCRRAVEIADQLATLRRLRKIVEGPGEWRLQLCAHEGEEDEGGSMKACIILPKALCPVVIKPVEKLLAAELETLGVTLSEQKAKAP